MRSFTSLLSLVRDSPIICAPRQRLRQTSTVDRDGWVDAQAVGRKGSASCPRAVVVGHARGQALTTRRNPVTTSGRKCGPRRDSIPAARPKPAPDELRVQTILCLSSHISSERARHRPQNTEDTPPRRSAAVPAERTRRQRWRIRVQLDTGRGVSLLTQHVLSWGRPRSVAGQPVPTAAASRPRDDDRQKRPSAPSTGGGRSTCLTVNRTDSRKSCCGGS